MRRPVAALGFLLALAAPPAAGAVPLAPIPTDHHAHVHSPAILGFLSGYCASPGRTSPCDPAFMKPLTSEDLLAAMDAAQVGRAWLMSTAYLAESPMMVPPRPDAAELVRKANDFTVGEARRRPDRFAAFIGVNPLTDTALPEIARWRGDPAVTGLKLHLTNSDVDLRNPAHVARLKAVFRAAGEARLIIMIHMRTRAADYGARDAETFIREVLPEAGPHATVVIAHSGGWGGLDAPTFGALGAFADAIERRPELRGRLWFDMAQVFKTETPPADLARLATLMRRIGVEHFVTGSDWPFAGDLASYYGVVYPKLPLTADEWRKVRAAAPPQP